MAGVKKLTLLLVKSVRKMSIEQAGITNPLEEIDCAEVYVPFSWYEPMWLENLGFAEEGEGWKLTMDGTTSLDQGGSCPWNCSGGVFKLQPYRRIRYDSFC